MKVSLEEVRRIAALAHLDLDGTAEELLRGQLETILDYVEQLDELDTAEVPPAEGTGGATPALREDLPGKSLPPDRALANAPDTGRDLFRVPRILPG